MNFFHDILIYWDAPVVWIASKKVLGECCVHYCKKYCRKPVCWQVLYIQYCLKFGVRFFIFIFK